MTDQRNAGGRKALGPSQRKQVGAWADEVRRRINERRETETEAARVDVKSLAESLGVARSTLINWMSGETAPDPWAVARIAEELSFPVDDQLGLLGWRPVEVAKAGAPSAEAHAAASPMLVRLRRVLSELEDAGGRFADLANDVGGTFGNAGSQCVDAALVKGHGRWEARAFRYRDGLTFPVLRETMIEFGLQRDRAPLTWDQLEEQYAEWLRDRAPLAYARDTEDEGVRDQIKRERLELRALLDSAFQRGFDGTFFGECGQRWMPLATLAKEQDRTAWTHLLAVPSHGSVPQTNSGPALVRNDSLRRLILIGPTYATARVVGGLVAEAIGWRSVAHETLTTLQWGRPRALAGERLRQLGVTLREWLEAPPDAPTVLTVTRHQSVQREPELARLMCELPATATALVVPSRRVLEAWDQQQNDNAAFSGGPVLSDVADMQRITDEVQALFEAQRDNRLVLPLDLSSIEPVSRTNFRDPRINDEQVRIAFRVCEWLGVSPSPESELGELLPTWTAEVRDTRA